MGAMKMIWKIQQKIPKLSESHDGYDMDENGTSGEGTSNLIEISFHIWEIGLGI